MAGFHSTKISLQLCWTLLQTFYQSISTSTASEMAAKSSTVLAWAICNCLTTDWNLLRQSVHTQQVYWTQLRPGLRGECGAHSTTFLAEGDTIYAMARKCLHNTTTKNKATLLQWKTVQHIDRLIQNVQIHCYHCYLQVLMHRHEGVKPHVCSECPKCFCGADVLKSHQLVHSGVKGFGCGLCTRSFRCKENVLKHFSRCASELRLTDV